jgi:POT family proton-dependent oligopeptide transporter
MTDYRKSPLPTKGMPSGIPYIIGNEAAERFSFYGMKAILAVFMTKYLADSAGDPDLMSEGEATIWVHTFNTAVYFTPLVGSFIADAFLGKYRTIISLSLVYCLGHLTLAFDESRLGLTLGLTLIAVGAGGIKGCVSAHVGDQFGKANGGMLEKVYGWFYLSINLGAFASTLLTPFLLTRFGPSLAFGVPGFLKLMIIYSLVAMFWALFDQTASTWVFQAEKMDRDFFGVIWDASQIQAVNPAFILLLIPLFNWLVYPAISRVFPLTPLRKIGIGFFLVVPSFLIPAWLEHRIGLGEVPGIEWQLLSYLLLTSAEVMISVTCLEFSYTQAPKTMKSLVFGLFMASVAMGNLFTSLVNVMILDTDGSSKLDGPSYYLFFAGVMLLTALLFIPISMAYKEKVYLQE